MDSSVCVCVNYLNCHILTYRYMSLRGLNSYWLFTYGMIFNFNVKRRNFFLLVELILLAHLPYKFATFQAPFCTQ